VSRWTGPCRTAIIAACTFAIGGLSACTRAPREAAPPDKDSSLTLSRAPLGTHSWEIRPGSEASGVASPTSNADSAPCDRGRVRPAIGRTDSLANAIAPQLAEWIDMWDAAVPGFAVDSLSFVERRPWTPVYQRAYEPGGPAPEQDLEQSFVLLSVLEIPSPDGRFVLNVDSYNLVMMEGDSITWGGEPDSRPLLVNLNERTESALHVWGTEGGFHWGKWLSPTSFALGAGGWRDWPTCLVGRLYVYSIPDSMVSEYETRRIAPEEYRRYRAEWPRWLRMRYEAIRTKD
jgi:hypothetical protein